MIFTEQTIINSFYITYVFFMTTACITFIEAMRTKEQKIRNILNLETCISVVAAFFYSKFVLSVESGKIDHEEINKTRYLDWAITTPIMLLVLVLAFLYNTKGGPLKLSKFVNILILNYAMLGMGYLGMMGTIDKTIANVVGFGFFGGLYYYIYKNFLKKYNFDNMLLFYCFLILWAMYGVFYQFDDITKNVGYNVLDLFSKCFVGIFFVCYFTKMFKL